MDLEEFVDIENYEGLYKVNKKGDIWGCKSKRLLKPVLNKLLGYYQIQLCKNGKIKYYYIHRLIAIHFIPNPQNLPCIDHINRIRTDNRIENLRWITHRDNSCNSSQTINRKGHIVKRTFKRKDGEISITYELKYQNEGEFGDKNRKSKSFKNLEEAETFRNSIYGY